MAPIPQPLVPSQLLDFVNDEALYLKELYDLLANSEVASSRSSKDIVCMLAGKTIGKKSRR
jgi:hypothetical protein